jgi:inosose dehydratase
MIRIGNAPVSYGAFEVTVGHDDGVPDAVQVLDAVRAAGYEGIDLGPVGYLGLGDDLREALASRQLLLAGGYVEIDVSGDDATRKGFAELAEVCDQFDAVAAGTEETFLPRPTVALLGGSAEAVGESESARWDRIERVIGEAVGHCDERGYQACLHNEVGTMLSSQESIERALSATSAHLCLDTGHLVAAGGDPVAIVETWRERVSHIHLKDARPAPSGEAYTEAMELWENDVFCPLGEGNGRIEEVLASLRAGDYAGWILVEQDVLPRSVAAYELARFHQINNRQYLRDRGW